MVRLFCVACVFMGSSGCAVRQMQDDQDKIRCALLELYTNQIIDNLIRASNGMPIIQIDYTNATAQITMKQTANVNNVLATTKTNVFAQALATTLTLTRNTVNTLTTGATGEHTNQVAVTGTPVTAVNEVYTAYLEFLTLPGSLQSGGEPPPTGTAQICKKCDKLYYWVPIEYRKEFLGLSLATTAQRGKALLPPEEFFKATLVKIEEPLPPYPAGDIKLLVRFNKKVPNDSGFMAFNLNEKDKEIRFKVVEYNPKKLARAPETTDLLHVQFDPEKMPKMANTVADLKIPMDVRLFLREHRPPVPTTSDLLDRVNFQLQQIQFNQLRGTGP